jgi:transcriptional regulator with XRE-family HTH domain
MSDIYKNIKRRREELGMSQEELALRLGYKSRSSINKIEMGLNDIPQSKVEAFAQALNLTPSELMGWLDEKKPHDKEHEALIEILNDLTIKELQEVLGFIKYVKSKRNS